MRSTNAAQVDAFASAPRSAASEQKAPQRRRPAILTSPHWHSEHVHVTVTGVLEEDARLIERPGQPRLLHLHLACKKGLHYVAHLTVPDDGYAQTLALMPSLHRGFMCAVLAEGLRVSHLEDGHAVLQLVDPIGSLVVGV